MSPTEAFVYEPLPEDVDSIRLLRVLPNSGSSDLVQCELANETIREQYTALSYTWGPPNAELKVQVNGRILNVRRNLWKFLIRVSISPQYTTQNFWIDAVCINQQDDRDKSLQVGRMGKIYESARHVIIWLAPADSRQHGPLDDLPTPITHFTNMTQCLFEQGKIHLAPQSSGSTSYSTLISDRYFRDLITQHDYWRRLWIVQEFLLNKERTILYGSLAVPWEIFAASQKHNKAEKTKRKLNNSVSQWLKSPRNFFLFVISTLQTVTDHVHREQTKFATEYGLPVPEYAGIIPAPSFSESIMTWFGRYVPRTLTDVIAWRTDMLKPPLPSMADILQQRVEENVDPRLPTRSKFSLFLQDLAETECFDRRDKIYGLAALISGKSSFPIDYSIDVYELYFRALRFFLYPANFSTEPCTLAPEYISYGLLDVFKIPLSALAENDSKKRSTNCTFILGADKPSGGAGTEPDVATPLSTGQVSIPPKRKDVHHFWQTFRNCLQVPVQKGQEIRIPCLHCKKTVNFHPMTLLKLQVASQTPIEDAKDGLVAVLQCLIADPASHSKADTQRTTHSHDNDDNNRDDLLAFEHLLLFYESNDGRPDALLNLEGQVRREGVLRSLSRDILEMHLDYGKQTLQKRSPKWSSLPY